VTGTKRRPLAILIAWRVTLPVTIIIAAALYDVLASPTV
jgi:phosphate/sulfate permease